MKIDKNIFIITIFIILIISAFFGFWTYRNTVSSTNQAIEGYLGDMIDVYIEQHLKPYTKHKSAGISEHQAKAIEFLNNITVPWPSHVMIYTSNGENIFCNQKKKNSSFMDSWKETIKNKSKDQIKDFSDFFVIDGKEWFMKTKKFEPWSWYITIGVDSASIREHSDKVFKDSLTLIVLLSASVALLMLLFFRFFVMNPIRRLSNKVDIFAFNKKQFKSDIGKDHFLNKLARNIEVMSAAIENHDRSMKELNARLEENYQNTYSELIKNEAKYRKLFENMINGCAYHKVVFENDVPVDYIFLDVNEAFEKHTGLKAKDMIGKKVTEVLPDIKDDPFDWIGTFGKVAVTGESISFEQFAQPLDKYFTISAFQIEKNYFGVTIQDITDTVKAQNDIIEINKSLDVRIKDETSKRLLSEKFMLENKKFIDMGQMINAIAHQWRQPLNALGLYIQDLKPAFQHNELDLKYLEETISESMELIQRMSGTIDDFKNFFSPGVKPRPFSIHRAVHEAVDLISSKITTNQIAYTAFCSCLEDACDMLQQDMTDCDKGSSLMLGYEGEFKQVLLNIFHNSFDAIEEKRITEPDYEPHMNVSIDHKENQIIIRITDNGIGISPENISKVFDPYFTTKDEGKGIGIGLYMSKNIVEKHMKGKISVESGGGTTTFTIILRRFGAGSEA